MYLHTPYSMVKHIRICADILRAMSEMSTRIACLTIESEVYYSTTKKIVTLQLASIFFGKSIQKRFDSVCGNDINNE